MMLPKVSGIDVCRELRARSKVPIIMVTAKGVRDRHGGRASRSAPTTTSPSPTGCASWWPACGPCCAGPRPTSRWSPPAATCSRSATCASTPSATRCAIRGERRRPPAQGVRAARAAARERRPGAHPRHADRPGLGPRLRRRHQDPRRARQAAAGQGRGRSRRPRPASSPSGAWATSSRPDPPPALCVAEAPRPVGERPRSPRSDPVPWTWWRPATTGARRLRCRAT